MAHVCSTSLSSLRPVTAGNVAQSKLVNFLKTLGKKNRYTHTYVLLSRHNFPPINSPGIFSLVSEVV